MDYLTLATSIIGLASAVLQLVTAILLYKAYKLEHRD